MSPLPLKKILVKVFPHFLETKMTASSCKKLENRNEKTYTEYFFSLKMLSFLLVIQNKEKRQCLNFDKLSSDFHLYRWMQKCCFIYHIYITMGKLYYTQGMINQVIFINIFINLLYTHCFIYHIYLTTHQHTNVLWLTYFPNLSS